MLFTLIFHISFERLKADNFSPVPHFFCMTLLTHACMCLHAKILTCAWVINVQNGGGGGGASQLCHISLLESHLLAARSVLQEEITLLHSSSRVLVREKGEIKSHLLPCILLHSTRYIYTRKYVFPSLLWLHIGRTQFLEPSTRSHQALCSA